MVAAGVVSMEDGFALIQKRAAAMQECAEQHPGCMAAILTSDTALIEQTCADADGYVVPANYNSNAQTVIAGEKSAVNAVCETLSAQKIRCVPLAVSAAFHTRLMQSAADAFQTQIKNFAFSEAKVDFFSNVTGKKHTDFTNMPSYLSKQIVSPVRFTSELQAAKEAGYDTFLELGPGKVLTGLVRKTLKDVSCQNVSDTASLAKALTLLQK